MRSFTPRNFSSRSAYCSRVPRRKKRVIRSGSVTSARSLRHGSERHPAARRQVEAPVGPLRHHLEQPEGDEEETRVEPELRPAARRALERHQRTPRQRRASRAKKLKERKATTKMTR